MRIRHPYAGDADGQPPTTVDVDGHRVTVAADGTFAVPDGATGWAERFAARYDASVDALRVDSTDTAADSATTASVDEVPFEPGDLTVAELEEAVDDIEDPAVLRGLLAREEEQRGRRTAIRALETRLDAVTDDTEV